MQTNGEQKAHIKDKESSGNGASVRNRKEEIWERLRKENLAIYYRLIWPIICMEQKCGERRKWKERREWKNF